MGRKKKQRRVDIIYSVGNRFEYAQNTCFIKKQTTNHTHFLLDHHSPEYCEFRLLVEVHFSLQKQQIRSGSYLVRNWAIMNLARCG